MRLRTLALWSFFSIVASFANPNTFYAPFFGYEALGTVYQYKHGIVELLTPQEYYAYTGDRSGILLLIGAAVFTLICIAAAIRKLRLSDALLYAGFALSTASAIRFGFFFILVATAIAGKYLSYRKTLAKKLRPLSAVSLAAFVVFLIFSLGPAPSKETVVDYSFLPKTAVDFISKNDLPGPLFNPYEWGGYITWRLYPQYKVFVDSRMIDYGMQIKYDTAKFGNSKAIFDEYGVNTVIFYHVFMGKEISGIVFSLLQDNDWMLVYFDRISVVFTKKGSAPKTPSIAKQKLWDYLTDTARLRIAKNPRDMYGYLMLGQIYSAQGQLDKAREAIHMLGDR